MKIKVRDCISNCGDVDTPIYVVGHSLGGALALTYVAAGFLEKACPAFTGPVKVMMFGAPRALVNTTRTASLDKAARVDLVINDVDMVPHLLGDITPLRNVVGPILDLSSLAQHAHNYRSPDKLDIFVLTSDRRVCKVPRSRATKSLISTSQCGLSVVESSLHVKLHRQTGVGVP